MTYEELCKAGHAELARLGRQGTPPALSDLVGWEFRGYNTNPGAELLRIRKFKKGFADDPNNSDTLAGYNVIVRQNGLNAAWISKMRHGEPHRHAPFTVRPLRPGECKDHENALLLDYKLPGKLPMDPSWILTDYLVQVYPDNPDLLLGIAYAEVGPVKVFGSFFVAERYNHIL
jgi:hypothetical protein